MKKFISVSKKLLSLFVAFTIVFSSFSGMMVVNAAAEVSDMEFKRIKYTNLMDQVDVLYIYGSGFTNPAVTAGINGTRPIKINETLSTDLMLVIDDPDEMKDIIVGHPNKIRVFNDGVDVTGGGLDFDLSSIPLVTSISKSKAYVGESLIIDGNQFGGLVPGTDKLYVSGTEYALVQDDNGNDGDVNTADITGGSIYIEQVKSPNAYGVDDVKITRYVGAAATKYEINSILSDSITVVSKIPNIIIERIDPNAGPKDKKNIVSIFGTPAASNFRSDMRIFAGTSEGTFVETISDKGNVIGIKFELPTRTTAGTVDLTLTTSDLSSDLVMPAGFTYLDIGNSLTIDAEGINPNYKKETEDKEVQIKGRNIGFFNGTSYEKIIGVTKPADFFYRYSKYKDYSMFNNSNYYKLKYTGVYQSTTGDIPVTIIRQFRVTIDGDATVVDSVYGENDYTPIFGVSKDTIYVKPVDVNLDPNEPKSVNVSIETITTILDEATDNVIYDRTEEYVVENGFTFLPDEIAPTITSITPGYGPSDNEIYMTVKGKDFQVLEDPDSPGQFLKPEVWIDNTKGTNVRVYDDNNRVVDGRIITLGTKIKFILPPDLTPVDGAVDVKIVNPSGGQRTLINAFQYKNPIIPRDVKITDVKEAYADLRGGIVSGETVTITGENFDTSADQNPRVTITIDGEKATILGKVSSDGKTVVIIPPPGTVPGMTKLQVINEDGSMESADFEYKLVTSNPKITSIVPLKGGKGTKLIIKGEDFVLPDNTVEYKDSKRKGSVVLLGGKELNAYKYNAAGEITDDATNSIYFDGTYDADGDPLTDNSLNGQMAKVQDITTIYVDIPDRFYSFVGGAAPTAPYLKSELIPIGALKVEVLNPDGARSKEDIKFNYMNPSTDPIITSISPNSGSVAGGTVVTITGSGFKVNNLEVYFGSEKSENVEFINSTVIRATVPDYLYTLPSGQDYLDVPVMALNYDGGAAVLENGFKYRVPGSNPIITSITPDKGSSAGNDRVVIKGLDFRRTPDMLPSGLPRVYFNGQEAAVEWPAGNTSTITESLTVTTPLSLTSGAAEVVLVNYDSGTFAYKGFTYVMSKPVINSVMPDKINKNGNVIVQIKGSGFRKGNLSALFSSADERLGRNFPSNLIMEPERFIDTIVAFADEDTGDKKIVDTVLGTMYTEIGDLRFDFTALGGVPEKVRVSISRASDSTHTTLSRYYMHPFGGKTFYSYAEADITVGSSHMFIINHEMDLDIPDGGDEGILVETTPSSITITRRIAAAAKVEYDGTQLTVKATPIDKVGARNLYVINDDGGTATGSVTIMSPDSSPIITSIDPKNRAREWATNQIVDYVPENTDDYSQVFTFVPLDGGAFLTISGADFRRNVKAYLNDRQLEIVSKSINDDQLVVKIPPGTEADLGKDLRITVVNEDGGSFDSIMLAKPHFIRYQTQESNPAIESIIPDKSSSRGSNRIAIYGNNFRAGVKVYIEGVEGIATRDAAKPSELLSVLVPTGLTPGKKTVQVQNPDFGFVEVKDGLTIISSPEITGIFDDKGDEINPLVLSVEGGEKIKLEGIQFIEGIRVIFGGTLKAKSELADGEAGLEGLNINNAEMVIIGGTIAAETTLQADGSVLVTTPKLDMGKTGVIVINSDGGISNEIAGEYQKPVPDTPGGIKVEVVDGDTFKLEWDKLEDINYYEIYVSVSETGKSTTGIYQYLGSIVPAEISETRLRYYLDGLMPSTWYSIKIRSVNLFGASKYSTSTGYKKTLDEKVVTFYQDETSNTGGVEQKDSTVMNGLELTYTLGEKSLTNSTGTVVNFEQPSYITANPKIVKVSYELINRHPDSRIKINDKDMELAMRASNLEVDEVKRVDNSLKDDTDMRVLINRSLGIEGDDIRIKLPRGYRIIVNPFSINLNMQVQNTTTRIKSFNGDISLLLKYAESKKSLYPGGVYIAYYDKSTGKLQIINTQDLTGKAQSQISKTGEYVLIGKLVK